MLDVYALAMEDTRLRKASRGEYMGACPNPSCAGDDRFHIKHDGNQWVFMCRYCWDSTQMLDEETARAIGKPHRVGCKRGWGDSIDYLRHYKRLSFKDAEALVKGDGTQAEKPARPRIEARKDILADSWQEQWRKRITDYTAALWEAPGRAALEYARKRGMSDETIKQFRFGFSEVEGIPRLLIPNIYGGIIYTIYRRDLRPVIPKDAPRWKDAPDGVKSELYLADLLKTRKDLPIVLVEDALSALSIWQEAGDLVNPVATGSANCGKLVKWLAKLALAPVVLIALDADEPGDKEAQYWLDRLENGKRLRPSLKDANDMLQAGYDIRQWVLDALKVTRQSAVEAYISQLEETTEDDSQLEKWVCTECSTNLYEDDNAYYDEANGLPYCGLHGTLGTSQYKTRASFVEYVTRLAGMMEEKTGVSFKVTPIEPGYTLDMHIARLAEEKRAQELADRSKYTRVRAA